MSYSKKYGCSRFDNVRAKSNYSALVFIIAALIVVLHMLSPDGFVKFRTAAFPYINDDVRASLSDLTNHVREGMELSAAIRSFCEEILADAKS